MGQTLVIFEPRRNSNIRAQKLSLHAFRLPVLHIQSFYLAKKLGPDQFGHVGHPNEVNIHISWQYVLKNRFVLQVYIPMVT